jgi:hypothetical protein
MADLKWARVFWCICFVVLLTVMVSSTLQTPVRVALAALLLSSAVGWVQAEKWAVQRELTGGMKRNKAEFEEQLIRLLNRYRHDWMNDIQVLFGYIQLKKYDNLPDYVDKIRHKIGQESYIARLGVTPLVAYLFAFREQTDKLQLEVEMEDEIRLDKLPLDKDEAARLIVDVIELMTSHVSRDEETDEPNTLSLELAVEEDYLLIDCVYRGGYAPANAKIAFDRNILAVDRGIRLLHADFAQGEASFAIGLPFQP